MRTKSARASGHVNLRGYESEALITWRQRTAWPTTILSLFYIAAYVCPIYFYRIPSGAQVACTIAQYAIWVYFVIDYAIQFGLASRKAQFLRHEWLALVIVVLPFFRPIRAIRGIIMIRQAQSDERSFIDSLPWILAAMATLLVLILGAAVLNAERFAPHATIRTPSDALWWAIGEITTSGVGNLSPVTNEGRFLASILLVFGLGLLASFTGLMASWVLHQFGRDDLVRKLTLRDETTAVPTQAQANDQPAEDRPESDGDR
jgi:voltage-gated potassium channel